MRIYLYLYTYIINNKCKYLQYDYNGKATSKIPRELNC